MIASIYATTLYDTFVTRVGKQTHQGPREFPLNSPADHPNLRFLPVNHLSRCFWSIPKFESVNQINSGRPRVEERFTTRGSQLPLGSEMTGPHFCAVAFLHLNSVSEVTRVGGTSVDLSNDTALHKCTLSHFGPAPRCSAHQTFAHFRQMGP